MRTGRDVHDDVQNSTKTQNVYVTLMCVKGLKIL